MFGDSTVRQWFFHLFNKLELKFSTQIWNATKWHRRSAAYKKAYNYELIWTRHGLPIYFGEINRGETRPVFVSLDGIPPGSNDILLIHLYAHFQYHHPKVFRTNIRRTVRSLKELLARSPNVSVAIKGPHYFSFRDRKTLGGMWGPIYNHILKEEFKELYQKVWFLDVWDMTVAQESRDVHPSSSIVKSMVNMFVDFVCS
ncbi:NXPE family member 3-like [Haliotis rubra]|uniref:NXPE family member 3-like n=1 Tax=Haliotis rubra TaxID=36100 RepID=UPI001EE616D4|nr:NXPE family member 3-like [Haliotis rubra]